ncbi:MAG: RluA family pseudouridine synthase [Candidatus Yanofskybacteria bacterium]|nr:RluA family pseudouridine synthase [Candidatus Yanofskybacteria bacterium]
MNLSIVYEDKDFFILNKPSGISVHKTHSKDPNKTLADFILEKYPEIKNVGDPSTSSGQKTLRPGIVHRLDKETSGLMIIAKTQSAFDYLKKQFQERKIKKTYLALVYGNLKNKTGIIKLPLGKLGTKQTTRIKGKKDLKEREAITEYKVLKTYNLKLITYSLLEVYPKTGRTHQIRVHLNAIGHPVVCDSLYGGRKKICPSELGRLFLHAKKLEFVSPSGQRLSLEVDPPEELTNFLNSITISEL